MVKGSIREFKKKNNWGGNIKTWSGMILQECTKVAENRDVWKNVAMILRAGRSYLIERRKKQNKNCNCTGYMSLEIVPPGNAIGLFRPETYFVSGYNS